MANIPVLVTGGAGYIGAHTCKALAAAGYFPITLDNLTTGHRSFVRWGPLVEGDIRDEALVSSVCREHKVEAAIHFAASALVGESVVNPMQYYQNNVTGSISLLAGLRAAGVQTIVFSSTCAVYGNPEKQPISEGTPPQPINPYGASKLMTERILRDFETAYGVCWAALRYFNACGADPDGELGELRNNETHLIPRAIMAALGRLSDFQIFGTDYPTPDGTAVRDYIHVSDLAKAHILCLKQLLSSNSIRTINVGTGGGYSVRQILAEISRQFGAHLSVSAGTRRAGDPSTLIADPTMAREQLGFVPELSNLTTIIKTSLEWHQRTRSIGAP